MHEHPDEYAELSVLGRAIRVLRGQREMSGDELAEAVDIGRENIEALESGRLDPSYELLVAVAEALGTQPSALVTLAEQLKRSEQT